MEVTGSVSLRPAWYDRSVSTGIVATSTVREFGIPGVSIGYETPINRHSRVRQLRIMWDEAVSGPPLNGCVANLFLLGDDDEYVIPLAEYAEEIPGNGPHYGPRIDVDIELDDNSGIYLYSESTGQHENDIRITVLAYVVSYDA